MNAHTGQWHLKRAIIRYSETAGDCIGVRFYLRHLLPIWKQRNPQVDVQTVHSQLQDPQLTVHFASGESFETTLRRLKARQVEDLLNHYRNSESPNLYLRHGGPRVWTERRSIQGMWQPSVEGMLEALRWAKKPFFPMKKLKYSPTSLRLSEQHVLEARGRWGPQAEFAKGMDKHILEQVFAEPFLSDPAAAEKAE